MPTTARSGVRVPGKRPSKREAASTDHAVYLIATDWGPVKIGRSTSPTARLSELQVGSHEALGIAKVWLSDRDGAKHLERWLHGAFRWAAKRGEWFATDWRGVAGVGDLYVSGNVTFAARSAEILGAIAALEREANETRHAWRAAKAIERRAVEAGAAARRAAIEVEQARLTIQLLDGGFRPPWLSDHRLPLLNSRRALEGLVRDADAKAA